MVAIASIALALVSSKSFGGEGSSAEASGPADFTVPSQGLVLRLQDLPPGYWGTSGSSEFPLPGLGCAAIEPADPRPRLAAFLRRYSPVGCLALYFRLYRVPDVGPTPLAVGTGALDVGSVEGAEAGLQISRELLSHLLDDELPLEVPTPETVGDSTRLFHWEPRRLFSSKESPSSFLVWRSGSVVASIFVTGGSTAANDQAALHFARIQQARIETRTPYTPAEADDIEVPLEDPGLKMPVYWLGRTFTPGSGFPAMKLVDTGSSTGPAGARVGLAYAVHPNGPHSEGLFVDVWSAKRWKGLQARRLPFPSSLRCPTVHRANRIRTGAAILRGFEPYDRRCRDRRHRAWALRVRFRYVVVTAETVDICATCAQAGTGPYDSFKGMATIARNLELRPQPVRPPADSP